MSTSATASLVQALGARSHGWRARGTVRAYPWAAPPLAASSSALEDSQPPRTSLALWLSASDDAGEAPTAPSQGMSLS
jgi:hypothetical protein